MTTQNDKITDRIRNLLALAGQKDNAAEAATAFAVAQKLATKHRIDLAQLQASGESTAPEDPMVRETIKLVDGRRVMGWKKSLLWGMQEPFGVYCVSLTGTGQFTVCGKSGDVDTAIYLYRAISAEIERLALIHGAGEGRAYVNAFKIGAVRTVLQRLTEAHRQTMQTAQSEGVSTTALACVTQSTELAKAWYLEQGHKVSCRTQRVGYSSGAGMRDGREAGKGIDIGDGRRAGLGSGNRALGQG